ncbi:MAG: hypothetical protein R2708_14405 [Vicinamibacterales bacterium]
MAPPTSDFDRRLRELEGEIKRLEVEYNQFFAGRLPKLPWDSRARVEALVKQYDRMHIQNTAERFRFQGLQSRFNAFCELWERNLKNRELGRPGPVRGRSADPPVSASPRGRTEAAAEPARPGGPIAVRDPEADAEKVRALHQQFNDARRRAGEAEVPFDRFSAVVRSQVEKLGSQGGGVAFRVREQDGRVSFTAKVADDESD